MVVTVLFEVTAEVDVVNFRMFSSDRVGNDIFGDRFDLRFEDTVGGSSSGIDEAAATAVVFLGRPRDDLLPSSVAFD